MRSLGSYTVAPDIRFRSSSRCGRLRVIRSMFISTLIGSGLFTTISGECPENLDLGLFSEQTCYILSAKIMVSEMLEKRHPRGTAGRAVRVAPKKLARTLMLVVVFGFAAQGGRERVDTISGRVRSARPKQQIVIYAQSGPWWVQPWPDHPFIPIKADSTWSTETHLGFEYAALLVEPDYHPLPMTDVAPTQGGSVALVTIVKGVGTPQFAPARSLKFRGYDWGVHMISTDKGGANNLYDPEYAWADTSMALHMQIRKKSDRSRHGLLVRTQRLIPHDGDRSCRACT